jgi:hypothetical protein
MRLGHLEKAILVACLQRRSPDTSYRFDPDLYWDELPGLLWGWGDTAVVRHERPWARRSGPLTGGDRMGTPDW